MMPSSRAVRGHPHQDAGGGLIDRRVKLHAAAAPPMAMALVTGNYSERFGSSRRLPGEGCKILSRVTVACASDGQVFSRNRVALLLKCREMTVSSGSGFYPEQLERCAESTGIDRQLVALWSIPSSAWAELDTSAAFPGMTFSLIVNRARAALQKMQVPIHRVFD